LDREDDAFLAAKVELFRRLLRDDPGDLARELELESAASRSGPVYFRVFGPGGGVRAETAGMAGRLPPGLFPEPAAEDRAPARGVEVFPKDGGCFRLTAARAAGGRGGPGAVGCPPPQEGVARPPPRPLPAPAAAAA